MRVLQIVPSLAPGGAQYMVAHLARFLSEEGISVAVVSLWGASDSRPEKMLRDAGIETIFLDKSKGLDVRVFGRISRVLGRLAPTVVHTHIEGLRYAMGPAWRHGIPVRLHTMHNMAAYEVGPSLRLVHRVAFRSGFEPVAIAESVSESALTTYGRRPRFMIPNGIDVDQFVVPVVPRHRWREIEGIPDDAFVLASVGRIERQKNHALLIRAFATALGDCPTALVLLAGRRTGLADDLEALAEGLGVADRVRILGERDDVADLLHACDVFVQSSDWEGNPLAIMEAMAAGRPVLATAVGGVPELVDEGSTGLLVRPGDQYAMSEALRHLFGDRDLAANMGRRAAQRARQSFEARTMARRYIESYRTLLGSGST